jgi:hypothetical protein
MDQRSFLSFSLREEAFCEKCREITRRSGPSSGARGFGELIALLKLLQEAEKANFSRQIQRNVWASRPEKPAGPC